MAKLPTTITLYGRKPIVIAEMSDERLVAGVKLLRAMAVFNETDCDDAPMYRALIKEIKRRGLQGAVRQEVGWIGEPANA